MTNTMKFLDEAETEIKNGDAQHAMHTVVSGLRNVRKDNSAEEWKSFVSEVKSHSMIQLALKCPFTFHAATKPAGYPGDASLIDHIYGLVMPSLDETCNRIYTYTTSAPAARAVRFRRHVMAGLIDRVLHQKGGQAQILSVACGHLRELDGARNFPAIRPKRFIALDQDPLSLDVVKKNFSNYGVKAEQCNIRDIIAGRANYYGFDLIYCAGLYDYLSDATARRLTYNLFESLNPGGTLFLTNFLPDIDDVGYMEAVMDWWLIYRNDEHASKMLEDIPKEKMQKVRKYHDPDDNITFIEVMKAG